MIDSLEYVDQIVQNLPPFHSDLNAEREIFRRLRDVDPSVASKLQSPVVAATPVIPEPTAAPKFWVCPRCSLECPLRSRTCEACNATAPFAEYWYCSACKRYNNARWAFCDGCSGTAPVLEAPTDLNTWSCTTCGQRNHVDVPRCTKCQTYSSHYPRITKAFLEEGRQEFARAEAAVADRKHLAELLSAAGLIEVQVADDGNCQFRALSWAAFRDDGHFHALRLLAVAYIRARKADFECVLESVEEYSAALEKDSTWGDEVTLRALANALGCHVHVVSIGTSTSSPLLSYPPEGFRPDNFGRHLVLTYSAPVHYNAAGLPGHSAVLKPQVATDVSAITVPAPVAPVKTQNVLDDIVWDDTLTAPPASSLTLPSFSVAPVAPVTATFAPVPRPRVPIHLAPAIRQSSSSKAADPFSALL